MRNMKVGIIAIALIILCAPLLWALSVNIDNGGSDFAQGDTFNLSVGVSNNDGAVTVDAYLALILPDGSLIFFDSGLIPYVGTLDPATWKKLVSNVPLPGVFNTGQIPLFHYTFTGAEPIGTYQTAFAIANAGTLNALAFESKSFSFGLPPTLPSISGTWSGTWVDTVYNVSGSINAVLSLTSTTFAGTGTIDLSALGVGTLSGTASGTVSGNTITFAFNSTGLGSGGGTFTGTHGSGTGTVVAPFGDFTFTGNITDTALTGNFTFTAPSGGRGTITMTKQ